jgi:LmbE family N-acetylglucosaminyl deacetylase
MKTIVVAPHPDDEVLGVGGTLFRRKFEGAKVAWLIVTSAANQAGWSSEAIKKRAAEIESVSTLFGFDSVFELNFPTTQLDRVPLSDLIAAISNVFKAFEPDEVFVPHSSDIHTDHRITFDAVVSCTKWFRHPSVKRVLAYETLSETDFGSGAIQGFRPNIFLNIEPYLANKLQAIEIYKSEMGTFPFPRSIEAIQALAMLRGAASGFEAAEAFELLRERL